MIRSNAQDSFISIISSAEKIYSLTKNMELSELETKLPDYTNRIKQYFLGLDKQALTETDIEDLKQLMSKHEKIVSEMNEEKRKISKNLKQLHTGKVMKKSYPQTII